MSANSGATESSTDAVNSSERPNNSVSDVSNGIKDVIKTDLLDSKIETLTKEVELPSDHGSVGAVHLSIDETRVSGDELGNIMEKNEKVLDKTAVNDEEKERDKVAVRAELLDSKTDTVTMEELSSDCADVKESIEKDAVVSSVQPNTSDIAVSNSIKIGDELLDFENRTRTMGTSSGNDADADVAAQDSIDDNRVFGDEKDVVMEDVEKFVDENIVNDEEKEGEYKVTDLVWGKVKSYPWWPGQIFDSSASTDKAKKYSNKKGFLIAYFGDQSFAWNKVSNIKPFRKSFGKMEKQSNSKKFCNAVNCALDEVSRRIEFGLACSCLSKEVYDKVKTQVFVNAGIKNEASRIDGGDKFSTVASLKPVDVVKTVQDLAREHFDGYNTLEVISVRSRLLAYYCWKGYNQFKAHDIVDGVDNEVEDNLKIPIVEEDKVVEDTKPASESEKVSEKRKLTARDSVPRKKERRLSDDSEEDKAVKYTKRAIVGEKVTPKKKKLNACNLVPNKKAETVKSVTPKGSSSVVNGKSKMKKSDWEKSTLESKGVKEDNVNEDDDKKSTDLAPKSFLRIGDRISRIAKQLSESPSPALLKNESQKSKHVAEKIISTDRKKKRKNMESVDE
ncbi:uncharacterized protein [Rutidosis leptorrhynchoides]|uniref:uncharacterized protein n=1 Tax=Rutidosis leptorrhynchoides TaxID=125765 RepID=UPI003A99DA3D